MKKPAMADLYLRVSERLKLQFAPRRSPSMSYLPAIEDSDLVDGLNVRYLKIFGLWSAINDYRTTGRKNTVIKLKFLITLLLAAPYAIVQFLAYFVVKLDLQKATFMNLYFLPSLQLCSKMIVFWFRMPSLCRILNVIRNDFLTIPGYKQGDIKRIFKKIMERGNIHCLASFVVNASILTRSVVYPTIPVDYIAERVGNIDDVTGGRRKIVGSWYPLPMAKSPYYEAIFVFETILITGGGLFLAVYLCFYYQVLTCLCAQFSALGYHISTLKINNKNAKNENLNAHNKGSSMYMDLYSILKDHQKLLSYASEMSSFYNPLVTMVLGMGIVLLTASIFQFMFGKTGNHVLISTFLQFLAYQAIEVFMFCYGSSSIETASSNLQFAVYSSDWYKADVKFRKAAQMVMLRARKGETLTAIKMYPVNVETIMAIFHCSYSSVILMSRMTK